jgi:hypothetical protein
VAREGSDRDREIAPACAMRVSPSFKPPQRIDTFYLIFSLTTRHTFHQ